MKSIVSNGSDYFSGIRGILENFEENQYHYTDAKVIALFILYVVVFIFGITGNCLILYWIIAGKYLKQRKLLFNAFLINLCISDIIVLFTCCPFVLYSQVTSIWIFGKFACISIHYLQGLAVTSNTLSMTALSFMRYLFVNHSLRQQKVKLLKCCLLVTIWLFSAFISLPILFVRKTESFRVAAKRFEFCIENWDSNTVRQLYSFIIFTFIYLLPCLVLIYCQISINQALKSWHQTRRSLTHDRNATRKRAFRMKGSDSSITATVTAAVSYERKNSQQNEENNSRHKYSAKKYENLARLLIGVILCFIFCWLPYNLISFFIDFTDSVTAITILPFTLLLGHSHSALNPLVYWTLNKRKINKCNNSLQMRPAPVRRSLASFHSANSVSRPEERSVNASLGMDSTQNNRYMTRF